MTSAGRLLGVGEFGSGPSGKGLRVEGVGNPEQRKPQEQIVAEN